MAEGEGRGGGRGQRGAEVHQWNGKDRKRILLHVSKTEFKFWKNFEFKYFILAARSCYSSKSDTWSDLLQVLLWNKAAHASVGTTRSRGEMDGACCDKDKVTKPFKETLYSELTQSDAFNMHSLCATGGNENCIRNHWTSPEIKSHFSHKNANIFVCVQQTLKAAALFVPLLLFKPACVCSSRALSPERGAVLMNGKLLWSWSRESER